MGHINSDLLEVFILGRFNSTSFIFENIFIVKTKTKVFVNVLKRKSKFYELIYWTLCLL